MARKKTGSVVEAIKTIVYAILIAIVIRTFAFEPFNIPSGSMIPTLLIGDYLFVSKYSYGYSRYSLPWGLPLISGRIFQSSPQRGDVVVFKLPADNKTDYIKRVIGLPGDQIQVIGGVLHINGQPVKLDQAPDYVPEGSGQGVTQYIESLPNGVKHPILKRFPVALATGESQPRAATAAPIVCGNPSDNVSIENFDPNNTPVYQVALGHYLMMGDNRDNSQDSRFLRDVGCPSAENLVGRARLLFFSTDGSAELWEPWKWPFAIRYSRLFQVVR
jgi:signal peptidase I